MPEPKANLIRERLEPRGTAMKRIDVDRAACHLRSLLGERGVISPDRLAAAVALPFEDAARLVQLSPDALRCDGGSAIAQAKLGQVLEILKRATDITGDTYSAIIWFKFGRLHKLGGETAEELVEGGRADAVSAYLHLVENGIYI